MKSVCIFIIIAFLSLNALHARTRHWNTVHTKFDSIAESVENYSELGITRLERLSMVAELEKIAKQERKSQRVLKWRSLYFSALSTYDTSKGEQLLKQALSMVDTTNFRYDYMRIRSRLLIQKSNAYQNALEEYRERREIIDYALEIGDTSLLAESFLGQGLLMQHVGDYYRSLDFFQEASRLFLLCGYKQYAINNTLNVANAYFEIGRRDTAYQILNDLLQQPSTERDTFLLTQLYATLGRVTTDSLEAMYAACESYRLAKAYGVPSILAQASINMGAKKYKTQEPDSVYFYYSQSWDYLRSHDDFRLLFPTLKGLFGSSMLTNRFDEALMYADTYFYYQDSIKQSQQALQISNLEQRHAIEQYEKTLEQEKELARNHTIIFYLTAALLALLVMGLGCFIYLQRKQGRLKEQNRKLELDAKNRELTAHELMLIEKNRMLEELEKRIGEGRAQGEIDHQTAVELRSQINAHVKRDNEWQNFHIQFEQVYPEFYTSLKKAAPTLTEGELRLCAFIRTGMDNKQIAAMLSQQPESVIKSRYRLRKKLPLTSGDSLEDYLRNI